MSYTAKHYVKIAGRKYTPGEIIDIQIPEEKLKRLLRLKAIAPASSADLDPADDTAGGDPKEPQDEEEPTEEEADEEAEAPEIDVMDGIVSAAEEPAEEAPPKKTTSKGRKKA